MLRHFRNRLLLFPSLPFGWEHNGINIPRITIIGVVAVFLHSTLKDPRQDRVNFQEIPPSVGLRFSSRIKDAPFSNSLLATVTYLRSLELGTSSSRRTKYTYRYGTPCRDTRRDLLKSIWWKVCWINWELCYSSTRWISLFTRYLKRNIIYHIIFFSFIVIEYCILVI